MGVVHDPEEVAEGVNRGGGDEAMATVLGRLELGGAYADGLGEHGVDVLDMPVGDDPGPATMALGAGDVLAVDDPELGLVVADPELDIARAFEAAAPRRGTGCTSPWRPRGRPRRG